MSDSTSYRVSEFRDLTRYLERWAGLPAAPPLPVGRYPQKTGASGTANGAILSPQDPREASTEHDLEARLRQGEQALYRDGDLRISRESFDAAYRLAEAGEDWVAAASAALGLSGLWVHEHRRAADAAVVRARLNRALERVSASSSVGMRLRARIAAESDYLIGDHKAILDIVREARALGDVVAWTEAASLAHHCMLGPDHGFTRRALAVELLGEAQQTGRRSDLLVGLTWYAVDSILDGDAHAARPLAELRDALNGDDRHAVSFVAQAIDVMFDIRAGRFEEAEDRAAQCARNGARMGDARAIGWFGAHMVAIRWYQGRIVELIPQLLDTIDSPFLSAADSSLVAALAVASATAGDHRQATGALARLGGGDLATLPRGSSWLVTLFGVAEAAHILQDTRSSKTAYDLLAPFGRLPAMSSLGVACFGSVQQALGLAAQTLGDHDRAIDHFMEALQHNLALGNWPAATLSRWRLADALGEKSPSHDAERARHLEAARREATELGMVLPEGMGHREAAPLSKPQRKVTIRRMGSRWTVVLGSRTALVEDSRGIQHLAILVANPGQEIRAVELASGTGGSGENRLLDGGRQPVLDDIAKRNYQERLSKLDAAIAQREAQGEFEQADQLQIERGWLIAELAAAAGFYGRSRAFSDNQERARIAVGKAIRRALSRIGAVDPVIEQHLRLAVQTGARCCYRPV